MIKHATGTTKPQGGYVWYEMDFLISQLTSSDSIIICFDTPPVLQDRLLSALQQLKDPIVHTDPYSLQTLVFDQIINLHDESVWSVRDLIRSSEKVKVSVWKRG